MNKYQTSRNDKKHLENKASKRSEKTHLTYCWLRADNSETNLTQLQNSHKRKSLTVYGEMGAMTREIKQALKSIRHIKAMIKNKDRAVKLARGQK